MRFDYNALGTKYIAFSFIIRFLKKSPKLKRQYDKNSHLFNNNFTNPRDLNLIILGAINREWKTSRSNEVNFVRGKMPRKKFNPSITGKTVEQETAEQGGGGRRRGKTRDFMTRGEKKIKLLFFEYMTHTVHCRLFCKKLSMTVCLYTFPCTAKRVSLGVFVNNGFWSTFSTRKCFK